MPHSALRGKSVSELSERLAIVLEATADLNEMLAEPDRLYASLLERLQHAVPYYSGSLQVMDGDAARVVAFRGPLDPDIVMGLRFKLDPLFPNYEVVTTRRPAAFEDIRIRYPHFFTRQEEFSSGHIRSWLGVPMVAAGAVIGMIALDRNEVDPFGEDDVRLVRGFADHAAVAIRNASVYRELQASIAAQDALMREMQHRVKNSLQLVASLIDIHAGTVEDATKVSLSELKVRIESISSIHARLYRRKDMSLVDLDEYLRDLADDIVASFFRRGAGLRLETDLERVSVTPKLAVPLGLIASELIMNSLKYAFPGGAQGTIALTLRRGRDGCELAVGDDGVGIPPERAEAGGFGTVLVKSLAEQVGGSAELESRPGRTVWTVRFICGAEG